MTLIVDSVFPEMDDFFMTNDFGLSQFEQEFKDIEAQIKAYSSDKNYEVRCEPSKFLEGEGEGEGEVKGNVKGNGNFEYSSVMSKSFVKKGDKIERKCKHEQMYDNGKNRWYIHKKN